MCIINALRWSYIKQELCDQKKNQTDSKVTEQGAGLQKLFYSSTDAIHKVLRLHQDNANKETNLPKEQRRFKFVK